MDNLLPAMQFPRMRYGTLPHVGRPVARLVIGGNDYVGAEQLFAIYDEYLAQGGNAVDTAHLYGRGRMERLIGDYLKGRGVRDQLTLITKGGMPPNCTPEGLAKQLPESLERLGVSSVDVYLLHRDNPEVPVGELVDVLNRFLRAGWVHSFGGSNWTRERFDEACAYAARHGLRAFSVLSNQHSLARMVNPPWPGCLSCFGAEWASWLAARQVPNLAWSAQARGFFSARSAPDLREDPLLVDPYYSTDNFERKRRAEQLAAERGRSAAELAAAYVLQQPYPSFAVVGPRNVAELAQSLSALSLELSAAELAWLELSADERGAEA